MWGQYYKGKSMFKIAVSLQKISNMASDWLAAVLPANQKQCLKILGKQYEFWALIFLSKMGLYSNTAEGNAKSRRYCGDSIDYD